jgi:hypothetical protein
VGTSQPSVASEKYSFVDTSAFLGTNPMDHAMTASLPMIECLLEAADRALYQMKCSGGGGVIAVPRQNHRRNNATAAKLVGRSFGE